MDTSAADPRLAMEAAAGQDLISRKKSIDALKKRLGDNKSEAQALRESCEGFESIFLQKMWEEMRKNIPKEGYLHSKDEEMYQSMFDVELSKKMTSAGGIGLADMLYEQLSQSLIGKSKSTKSGSARPPIVPPSSAETLAENRKAEMVKIGPQKEVLLTVENLYSPLDNEKTDLEEKKEPSLIEQALADLQKNLPEESLVELDQPLKEMPVQLADNTPTSKMDADGLKAASWQNTANISAKPRPISKFARKKAAEKTEAADEKTGAYPPFLPNKPSWPLQGNVSTSFGWQDKSGSRPKEWNPGVAIEARAGSQIVACMPGTISFAGPSEGYENLIVIDHGDSYKSYYGNATLSGMIPGDKVDGGMVFASVVANASNTESGENNSSLYFSLKRGEMALNPEAAIPRFS